MYIIHNNFFHCIFSAVTYFCPPIYITLPDGQDVRWCHIQGTNSLNGSSQFITNSTIGSMSILQFCRLGINVKATREVNDNKNLESYFLMIWHIFYDEASTLKSKVQEMTGHLLTSTISSARVLLDPWILFCVTKRFCLHWNWPIELWAEVEKF